MTEFLEPDYTNIMLNAATDYCSVIGPVQALVAYMTVMESVLQLLYRTRESRTKINGQ